MKNNLNVLSLFDGMSCGQIALERAGIPVNKYYASEIDKYAIKMTQSHFPNTIQLGDVQNWRSWDLPKIDLLIGGSPCQGFSNAGKGLNFDDPRSKLFFTYVDILKEIKPKFFLLENVKMKKEWQKIISEQLGVEPIEINSALVSAQNRKRLFWTNWKFEQPEDRGIFLKDIIENGEVDRTKSYTIDANYFKGGNPRSYFEDGKRQLVFEHQSHKQAMVKVQGAAIRNQVTKRGVEEQLNIRKDEKSNCVVPTYPNKLNGVIVRRNGHGYIPTEIKEAKKSDTLREASQYNYHIMTDDFHYRKLTPIECERLQTVDDNWTAEVSNTQRYKMLGNGWTVDVVAHIFSGLPW